MNLKEFTTLLNLQPDVLAKRLGVSTGYLTNVINGHKKPSAHLSLRIEALTLGKVSKEELRPDIYLLNPDEIKKMDQVG